MSQTGTERCLQTPLTSASSCGVPASGQIRPVGILIALRGGFCFRRAPVPRQGSQLAPPYRHPVHPRTDLRGEGWREPAGEHHSPRLTAPWRRHGVLQPTLRLSLRFLVEMKVLNQVVLRSLFPRTLPCL